MLYSVMFLQVKLSLPVDLTNRFIFKQFKFNTFITKNMFDLLYYLQDKKYCYIKLQQYQKLPIWKV